MKKNPSPVEDDGDDEDDGESGDSCLLMPSSIHPSAV
jgi:hypothetical protein